jgi:hypothetical protein
MSTLSKVTQNALDKNKPLKISPCWCTLFSNDLQAFSTTTIIIIIIIMNQKVVNR